MVPDRQQLLAVRYRDALIGLRRQVSARVARNWANLGSWNEADVPRFLSVTLPSVAAAQRRTVSLTDAYLSRAGRVSPVGLDPDSLVGAGVRAGAEPAEVYRRPFVQLWSALSDGARFADAMSAAGSRAAQSAATDVSLSMRAAAESFASEQDEFAERVIGWERVIDPDACAFCATASTQRYSSPNLQPLHTSCECGVAPVFAESDRSIKDFNANLLDNMKEANRGASGAYWESRKFRVDGQTGEVTAPAVAVREHGELGAVLVDAGQKFSGPSAVG